MLAVKMVMPESLWNFRLSGTTLKYEEFLIALESIIIDKVPTAPTIRQKRRQKGSNGNRNGREGRR